MKDIDLTKCIENARSGLAVAALAITLVTGPAVGHAAKPEAGLFPIALVNDLLLEFMQPKAGQEAASRQWSERHLKQLVQIPGIKAGQFLIASAGGGVPGDKPAFEHLSMYELAADAALKLDMEVEARRQDGRLQKDDNLFEPAGFHLLFRPLWSEILAKDIPGSNPEPLGSGSLSVDYLFVLSDPSTPDQEEAYNTWYDHQHVPDVLRVPGFVSAQRYVRVGGDSQKPRYMVIFKFRTRDNSATSAEIRRRIEQKITKMSPAFGSTPPEMRVGGTYVPSGPQALAANSK